MRTNRGMRVCQTHLRVLVRVSEPRCVVQAGKHNEIAAQRGFSLVINLPRMRILFVLFVRYVSKSRRVVLVGTVT